MLSLNRAVAVASASVLLVLAPSAQCPNPDLFDGGPCCTITVPQLPKLPGFNQSAFDICWRDCNIDQLSVCVANWTIVQSFGSTGNPCRPQVARLRLVGGGAVKWDGILALQYARTWVEIDPNGTAIQVWRYLVNGDLRATAGAGTIPCPVPPCAPVNGGRVRYTGYVDFALDCNNNKVSKAWMLTHACDAIDHVPGFPRGGPSHPDRSYTFVGPAATFAPGPFQPIEAGVAGFESMRRVRLPVPGTTWFCDHEEFVPFASLALSTQLCFCNTASLSAQFAIQSLFAAGVCGSSLSTSGFPFFPGLVSMGIGSWVNPLTYPGVEALRWNCGGYDDFDGCSGVTTPKPYFGVSTLGGFPALELTVGGIGAPLPPTFVDQSSSIGTAFLPTLNVPFQSDHFVSFNF